MPWSVAAEADVVSVRNARLRDATSLAFRTVVVILGNSSSFIVILSRSSLVLVLTRFLSVEIFNHLFLKI